LKFKFIFIIFSGILFFFLIMMFFLPFMVFGNGFALSFWRSSWPLILLLLLILLGVNGYYFTNRRLFFLLEREDWPALVQYLERRVIQEGHYRSHLVRLLANSYLVLSDAASVTALEAKLALARPALVERNVLLFGAARILGKDNAGGARFFSRYLGSGRTGSTGWIRWYYGFSLLLNREFARAAEQFGLLARESKDGILTGLSAFFLADSLPGFLPDRREELLAAAGEGRTRVLEGLVSAAAWKKEAAKMRTEIHAAVLSRYIRDAGKWLYGPGGETAGGEQYENF
jgi:hypothetical protein